MVFAFELSSMNETHEGSPNHDPLEDEFIMALIDSVQRNPCVYNRYDPLHKVTEYKHEIWKMISNDIGYNGEPIELERKWKHMRDKYVRLRKQDKQRTPLKQTNKWYNYYHKMSFLDPYVEHRNRKRQKDYLNMKMQVEEVLDEVLEEDFIDEGHIMKDSIKTESAASLGYESSHTSSSNSSGAGGQRQRNIDSPEVDVEDKNLIMLYDKLLGDKTDDKRNGQKYSKASNDWELLNDPRPEKSRKRKNPSRITPGLEKSARAEVEESLKGLDEDQVTFFIRSIAKTLVDMDRKKFAMARIEISKVLYNIEFGKIQYSEHGAM